MSMRGARVGWFFHLVDPFDQQVSAVETPTLLREIVSTGPLTLYTKTFLLVAVVIL